MVEGDNFCFVGEFFGICLPGFEAVDVVEVRGCRGWIVDGVDVSLVGVKRLVGVVCEVEEILFGSLVIEVVITKCFQVLFDMVGCMGIPSNFVEAVHDFVQGRVNGFGSAVMVEGVGVFVFGDVNVKMPFVSKVAILGVSVVFVLVGGKGCGQWREVEFVVFEIVGRPTSSGCASLGKGEEFVMDCLP